MTLIIHAADGRDLGILRLATLRPSGFSDDEVGRARFAARRAGRELGEALDAVERRAAEPASDEQGVVILDELRRIRVVSPVAENMLGWRSDNVRGLACGIVFDCRDTDGQSMCVRCGLTQVFESQEVVPPAIFRMAEPGGGRQEIATTFCYLPPAGSIHEPRAMAVVRKVGNRTLPSSRPRSG
jgi:PAS domain-containing protein